MNQPATIQDRVSERDEAMRIAKQKLVGLLKLYPRHTPPEHIIFGYGGVKITFSDLLDAFGVDR